MLKRFSLILLAALLAGCFAAQAAGPRPDKDPENRTERELAKVEGWIEEGKYGRSVRVLNGLIEREPENADAYNLLGYVHRKMGNLDDSARYYKQALVLDPDHKGALEYQGELFLKQNKPDKAKGNLERLEALCPDGCEERDELAAAIAAHEKGEKPKRKSRW
ncbi:MAG: tetratricopeptide repeat protein [Alphaproteobacteria bacterium]